jgi:limonene-1,2-epoxide hydrolase
MDEFTDTFIKALERLEAENDVELIAGLFSENATLSNPKGTQDSAAAFWTTYRKSFDEVRSSFSNVNQSEGVTFLEWTSEGKIEGQPFSYEGVSVFEVEDGTITAFRSYFDPTKLTTAIVTGGPGSQAVKDDVTNAQRDAAEQRAGGGYGG